MYELPQGIMALLFPLGFILGMLLSAGFSPKEILFGFETEADEDELQNARR